MRPDCCVVRLGTETLADYPRESALLRYLDVDGIIKDWVISAHFDHDNETTLQRHLARYRPGAKLIGWELKL